MSLCRRWPLTRSAWIIAGVIGVLVTMILVPSAPTQTPIWMLDHPWAPPSPTVGGAGDVDGDGFNDVIVGLPAVSMGSYQEGAARVYSGRTGETLLEWSGGIEQLHLGADVAGIGDVDDDGHDDVAISCGGQQFGTTLVASRFRVYSGADASLLYELVSTPAASVGGIITGVGDVDADGHADFVHSMFDAQGSFQPGMARVVSGSDFSELFVFTGEGPGDDFGLALSAAGDVDSDGHADILVGAPEVNDFVEGASGYARVFSGADGHVIHGFDGNGPGTSEEFGASVAGGSDVDGDGVPDLVVGSRQDNLAGLSKGAVWIFSGADASVIHVIAGELVGGQLGWRVAMPGDLDHDRHADVLSWARYAHADLVPALFAWSGADASVLFEIKVDHGTSYFPYELEETGDVDGDGTPDFVHEGFSGPGDGVPTVAWVRSGHKLLLPDLGFALAGSFGKPSLIGESSLHRKTPLVLQLTGLKPATAVWFVVGASALGAPFKGGVLLPFPDLLFTGPAASLSGAIELQLTVTWSLPAGTTLYLQAWQPGAGGPAGYAASNAVALIAP